MTMKALFAQSGAREPRTTSAAKPLRRSPPDSLSARRLVSAEGKTPLLRQAAILAPCIRRALDAMAKSRPGCDSQHRSVKIEMVACASGTADAVFVDETDRTLSSRLHVVGDKYGRARKSARSRNTAPTPTCSPTDSAPRSGRSATSTQETGELRAHRRDGSLRARRDFAFSKRWPMDASGIPPPRRSRISKRTPAKSNSLRTRACKSCPDRDQCWQIAKESHVALSTPEKPAGLTFMLRGEPEPGKLRFALGLAAAAPATARGSARSRWPSSGRIVLRISTPATDDRPVRPGRSENARRDRGGDQRSPPAQAQLLRRDHRLRHRLVERAARGARGVDEGRRPGRSAARVARPPRAARKADPALQSLPFPVVLICEERPVSNAPPTSSAKSAPARTRQEGGVPLDVRLRFFQRAGRVCAEVLKDRRGDSPWAQSWRTRTSRCGSARKSSPRRSREAESRPGARVDRHIGEIQPASTGAAGCGSTPHARHAGARTARWE